MGSNTQTCRLFLWFNQLLRTRRKNVFESTPIDIHSVRGPMQHFSSEIFDFAYAVIGAISMEFFIVKYFYWYYFYLDKINQNIQGMGNDEA